MHLLAPWWAVLWVPLAGGVILLYLLKLRRREQVVPSVFLWEQALQDLQANAPLQKLRKNILLLLQLLILLVAVLALMRPAMAWRGMGGRSVVLVIDASASMQCTDVLPSRFAAARQEAHRTIEALGAHDRLMLVAIGGATRALTSFTADKRTLHTAVDRLQVTDARADLRAAFDLVAGLAGKGRAPDIAIISDGAVPALQLPVGFQPTIHFTRIGARGNNIGITMMSARRRLSGSGRQDGLITVQNFASKPRTLTLSLALDGTLFDARELTLPARTSRTEVLPDLPVGGVLTATLDVADDLAVDNTAQLVLPRVAPLSVVLATTGNLFLSTALGLDPTLTLQTRATPPATLPAGTVLVADNVPVGALSPDVSALLTGTVGTAAPATVVRTVDAPAIVDWDHRHPALAHLDLSTVHLAAATVLKPAPGAHVLIETDAGPIAVAQERHGQRIICLGWDLQRSDFPLSAAFPIFVGNCIDWLSGARQRAQVVNVRTGDTATLALPTSARQLSLHRPDRRIEPLTTSGSTLVLDRLTRAGVYRVNGRGLDVTFTANLFDSRESDTTPATPVTARDAGRVVNGPVRTERESWRGLLLLVILLLSLEWWIFHRRIG